MNFSSQVFYEDGHNQMISGGKLPFYCNNSSSSAASHPQENLLPLTFHQHQRGRSNQNNDWMENHGRPSVTADDISSIRHYNRTGEASSNMELMDTSAYFRNNSDEHHEGAAVVGLVVEVEREHMFDKVVTPSDVGKLNRLVIPKQHAERYFPLDSATNEKGLLLNFEDRTGKPWRFRYSYWNSSQSYVMTKGWSRFVKDKKLDAGDIVSFQRGLGQLGKDRLFIDWRRRPEIPHHGLTMHPPCPIPQHYLSFQNQTQPWSSAATHRFLQAQPPLREYSHFHHHHHQNSHGYNQPRFSPSSSYGYDYGTIAGPYPTCNTNSSSHPYSSSVIYLRPGEANVSPPHMQTGMVQFPSPGGVGNMDTGSGIGIGAVPMVLESVPMVQGKAQAKRLRLFGVNMDCPISESDECEVLSSSITTMPNGSTMVPWPPHPPPYVSSSSANIHPLQLRLYNGSTLSTTHPEKSNAPHKSFDLDF